MNVLLISIIFSCVSIVYVYTFFDFGGNLGPGFGGRIGASSLELKQIYENTFLKT